MGDEFYKAIDASLFSCDIIRVPNLKFRGLMEREYVRTFKMVHH
jgi:hypothetical protein